MGKKITELRYLINKSYVYYSADDGSIGYFKSISKQCSSKINVLYSYLCENLPFKGGLNPLSFFRGKYLEKESKGNIFDIEVINS